MRRPLAAVVGVLAALMVMATAAVAVTVGAQRGEAPGYRMHTTMRSPGDAGRGWGMPGGMHGGMHGAAASSELEYLAEMVAHHEEAVAAAAELRRSDRPQLRAFGESIIATQSAQIDQMNGWLARWYPGRPTDVDYRPMMRDLSGLSGDALDETFLRDMVGHHMMAVMMSQHLLASGVADHEQVDALAEVIRDEQHAEIHRMRRWLADWFDAGPGMGMGMGMAHGVQR